MSIQSIKKSQKESLLYKAISNLIAATTRDDNRLGGMMVNRVKLSDDKSVCTVFFYTVGGLPEFEQKLPFLLLYKSSLRRALAKSIASRYTPELIFKFDDQFEKQQRIENILEKIKGE
jgi:ribosome-binding factor A